MSFNSLTSPQAVVLSEWHGLVRQQTWPLFRSASSDDWTSNVDNSWFMLPIVPQRGACDATGRDAHCRGNMTPCTNVFATAAAPCPKPAIGRGSSAALRGWACYCAAPYPRRLHRRDWRPRARAEGQSCIRYGSSDRRTDGGSCGAARTSTATIRLRDTGHSPAVMEGRHQVEPPASAARFHYLG